MEFKDTINTDLDSFINGLEFAETINFNNQDLQAVLIRNTKDMGSSESAINGVHSKKRAAPLIGDYISIYFKLDDYAGELPKYSEFVTVNGIRYKVAESAANYGMAQLILSTDRMNIPELPRLERGF